MFPAVTRSTARCPETKAGAVNVATYQTYQGLSAPPVKAMIRPQIAIGPGLAITARTDVRIARPTPTSRSSSMGNDTALMVSTTTAKMKPTPMPMTAIVQPAGVVSTSLAKAGLTEQEARVELACRLFDIGKLALWPAAQLAGMSRVEFEGELASREIPIYRPTVQDIEDDLAAIERFRGRA